MNLHRLARHPDRNFACKKLGHRAFACHRPALRGERSGAPGKQPGGVNVSRHVGEFETGSLKFSQCLPELPSLFGVIERRLEGALSHSYGERSNRDAPPVKDLQAVNKSLSALAEAIVLRNPAVLKNYFAGITGPHPQFRFFFAWPEAWSSLFDDEGRNAVFSFVFISHSHGHADAGIVTVRGKCFCSVQNPGVALKFSDRSRSTRVGAGLRLRKTPAPQRCATRQRNKKLLFLLFCAAQENMA